MPRILGTVLILALCTLASAQATGPANVFREDGGCSIGWFGCLIEDATLLPDGNYTCEDYIDLMSIEGDWLHVVSNSQHGNEHGHCKSQIVFRQPNPRGALGGSGQVIAVPFETVCNILPDACNGNGSFIANPRTIGSLAVCRIEGVPTTNMQQVVTRSGRVSLTCRLPDPSPLAPMRSLDRSRSHR